MSAAAESTSGPEDILKRIGAMVSGSTDRTERANAFSAHEQQLLEECARAALPLWVRN